MKLAGSEGKVDNIVIVGTSMDKHSLRSQVGMGRCVMMLGNTIVENSSMERAHMQ